MILELVFRKKVKHMIQDLEFKKRNFRIFAPRASIFFLNQKSLGFSQSIITSSFKIIYF